MCLCFGSDLKQFIPRHFKRKVLEIFNMNKKNVIARFLILNPLPIIYDF